MTGLGWLGVVRLGLVQAAIGSMVMLSSSLLNRVMVVEYALAAAVPAGFVAWHYAVQLSRPLWGHRSDRGRRRTPWIIGGMACLVFGTLLAVDATVVIGERFGFGLTLAILAFTMIGAGVGAAGTSLLALLATLVAPQRRAGAAALTWIMMVAGIAVSASVAGSLLEPFSVQRLALVASGIALVAFFVTVLAVFRIERGPAPVPAERAGIGFEQALREMLADREARRFTLFVFVSMLAYSMQDLILEPFAGLVFAMTPGQSTTLSGAQHGGVLAGMILAGVGGSAFGGRRSVELDRWIIVGCLGSAAALAALALAAAAGPGWPLVANVVALGVMNGVFAVAAVGTMLGLAGAAGPAREGIRMGVWGAAQAVAFGAGGLIGAVGVDAMRLLVGQPGPAFQLVFGVESALFLVAALLMGRAALPLRARRRVEA